MPGAQQALIRRNCLSHFITCLSPVLLDIPCWSTEKAQSQSQPRPGHRELIMRKRGSYPAYKRSLVITPKLPGTLLGMGGDFHFHLSFNPACTCLLKATPHLPSYLSLSDLKSTLRNLPGRAVSSLLPQAGSQGE